MRADLHPEKLRAWGEAAPRLAAPGWRVAAIAAPALTLAAIAGWVAGVAPAAVAQLLLIVQTGIDQV